VSVEHAITLIPAVGDRLYAAHRLIVAWSSLFEDSLLNCDLAYHTPSSRLSAIARFDPKSYGPDVRARFCFWASRAGVTNMALGDLRDSAKAQFLSRFEQSNLKRKAIPAKGLIEALDSLWTSIGIPPERRRMPRVLAELALDLGPAGTAVSYDASEGGLFVRADEAPPIGDNLHLRLTVPGVDQPFELDGRVAHVRSPQHASTAKPAGFGISFATPSTELVSALSRYLAQCQPKPVTDDRRAAPRYPTHARVKVTTQHEVVRLRYASDAQLVADYVQNLSIGGAFVRTAARLAVDTPVKLELQLADGQVLTGPGRVVHVVANGMGIQFELNSADRDALQSIILGLTARPKRVLLLDSNSTSREMLSNELSAHGYEVLCAGTGDAGLQVIFDELLTLEVLVADLNLSGLGVEALVDIIRRAGGEKDLAIVVIAQAATTETRERLRRMEVDAVFERGNGAPVLAKQIVDLLAQRPRSSSWR
jgi:Tfp pilus assembly protein PilZ/CheY-like chemotaxis protein